jgi:hypothetical protein
MQQNYPDEPFRLISAEQVLGALNYPRGAQPSRSQTELGMDVVAESLASSQAPDDGIPGLYRRTAALAWLALNAETNIRQNEKIAGLERVSAPEGPTTSLVLGPAPAYSRIEAEIEAALEADRAVGAAAADLPPCVGALKRMSRSAAEALEGRLEEVVRLAASDTEALGEIHFSPVIAEIGMELKDGQDGTFRLHLATGRGRSVPARIGGRDYTLWTPSAMVLHLADTFATRDWQWGGVDKYDGDR